MLTALSKPARYLPLLLSVFLLCGCSSTGTHGTHRTRLDEAIAFFINGDHARAEDLLIEITREGRSDEELRTAWLYLGRIYLAKEEYVRAGEAFSTGKMLGGGAQFDGYITETERHLRTAARSIRTQPHVTRAQLAALIGQMFPTDPVSAALQGAAEAGDIGHHWAEAYIGPVLASGMMDRLPDGGFHPDAPVTRVAFFFIARRVCAVNGIATGALDEIFPGGIRALLATGAGDGPTVLAPLAPRGPLASLASLASGGEVVAALEALRSKANF